VIPNEFAAFVRDTGIRAFDRVAGRKKTFDKSLQSVLKSWSKLTDAKKNELFDQLIASARDDEESPEPPKKLPRKKKA
jgi:hypothetical protein